MSQQLNDIASHKLTTSSKVKPSTKTSRSSKDSNVFEKIPSPSQEREPNDSHVNPYSRKFSRKLNPDRPFHKQMGRAWQRSQRDRLKGDEYIAQERTRRAMQYETRRVQQLTAREPTTWHLPHLARRAEEYQARKESGVLKSDPVADAASYDRQLAVLVNAGRYKSFSTMEEMAKFSSYKPPKQGFASDAWSKPKPAPVPETQIEIRGSVLVFDPRMDRIPLRVLPRNKIDHFTNVLNQFLSKTMKIKNASFNFTEACKRIQYNRCGPHRIGMNTALAKLIYSDVSSLRRNLSQHDFDKLIYETNMFSISLKWKTDLPPTSETRVPCIPAIHGAPPPRVHLDDESEVVSETPAATNSKIIDNEVEVVISEKRQSAPLSDDDDFLSLFDLPPTPPSLDRVSTTALCGSETSSERSTQFPSLPALPVPVLRHYVSRNGTVFSIPERKSSSSENDEFSATLPLPDSHDSKVRHQALPERIGSPSENDHGMQSYFAAVGIDLLDTLKTHAPALARILALLYVLRRNSGKYDVWLATFVLFLDDTKLSFMRDAVMAFLDEVFNRPHQYQSATSLIDNLFLQPFDMAASSTIVRSAWELFSSFSIHGLFQSFGMADNNSIIGSLIAKINPMLKKGPGNFDPLETFLVRLVNFTRIGTTLLRECVIARSFAPLFSSDVSVAEWRRWSNFLLHDTTVLYEPGNTAASENFKKKQIQGYVPHNIPNQLTRDELDIHLRRVVALGETLAERHKGDGILAQEISRMRAELTSECIARSLDGPHGAFRVQPFGIMIIGAAGVGKSMLCNDLHLACAHASGHRTDSSGVLRLDASTNFADGAIRGQNTVLFDDVDSKPSPVTAGHDDHVTLVNKYMNVVPLSIEKAAVEEKGKLWANFTLGLYASNFNDCRLRGYCNYPPMFWRRWPYRIVLSVKSEYATASGSIDHDKIPKSGPLSIHNFTVMKLDPSLMGVGHDFDPPYSLYRVFTSRVEFFGFITKEYTLHYEREKTTIKKANADRHALPHCPVCHLPLEEHDDGSQCEVRQMLRNSTDNSSLVQCVETVFMNSPWIHCSNGTSKMWSPYHGTYLEGNFVETVLLGVFFPMALVSTAAFYATMYTIARLVDDHTIADLWIMRTIRNYTPFRATFTFWMLFAFFALLVIIFPNALGKYALFFWSLAYAAPNLDPLFARFWHEWGQAYEFWFFNMIRPPVWAIMAMFITNARLDGVIAVYERMKGRVGARNVLGRFNINLLDAALIGIAVAIPAVIYWTTREREVHGLVYQMDENGIYREYRRPPGVPVGATPYKRVVQADLLVRPYGVRANPPTFSFSEMEVKIRDRLAVIKTQHGTVYGFRIEGSLIVCNKHVFLGSDGDTRFRPLISTPALIIIGDQSYQVRDVANQAMCVPGKDLVILHVPSIPPFSSKWNFPSLLCDFPPTTQAMADQAWLISGGKTHELTVPARIVPYFRDPNSAPVWRYDADTVDGDCGSVLVIRRGAHFSIAGLHTALVMTNTGAYRYAESISKSEYDKAIRNFSEFGATQELQLDPNQILGHCDIPPLQELPFKSSLGASLANEDRPVEAVVFGTVEGLGGASLSSRCVDTIFRSHPEVRKLEDKLGGFPYFFAPKFRGAMEDDKWIDPHTVSLSNVRNEGGNRKTWMLALDDYLDGVEGKSQREMMSPLDDYAAFFGIPDTVIGGTNMQSSAGPPFYARKSSIIRVDHTSEPKILEWDVGFARQLKVIEKVIRSGSFYSPLCLHVLKDEVVSKEKNDKHKIRVFNILPFAYNHLMKRYLSPLTAFMRQHSRFFESVVGMNITDLSTATDLFEFIDQHPNCLAFDKSSFDARCSTEEHMFVSLFFKRLAFWCGYTKEDCDFVFTLCMSAIYPIRSIKGDMFMITSSMPSGFWMTIHFNCVRSSLQARYAWFKINPDAGSFRANVHQVVLGDDLLATVSSDCWWYNQVSIANALCEIGAKTTSFRKNAELDVYEKLSEVQFLKRTPRRVEDVVVWAIDPKTIYKMLCMRLESTAVPSLDAHAMLLSNVLAESWMWGSEFFAEMSALVTSLALKHGLDKNVYFRNRGFHGYLSAYKDGSLIVWDPEASSEIEAITTSEVVSKQLTSLQEYSLNNSTPKQE